MPSGDVYEGQWLNNKPHGAVSTCMHACMPRGAVSHCVQGWLKYASGLQFQGVFESGKRHGIGARGPHDMLSAHNSGAGLWTSASGEKELVQSDHDADVASSKGLRFCGSVA